MGLLAATMNKQYLLGYKNELEYKISLINQAKMALMNSSSDLLNAGTDYDPENPVVKQLEQRKERLNLLEKKLDAQMNDYQIKLQMIDKSIQACDKQIEGSIR